MTLANRRVLIIQRLVPHYRLALYEGLHARLAAKDVCFTVVAGQSRPDEAFFTAKRHTPWLESVHNRYLGPFYWQPVIGKSDDMDLVIMEHANAPLANHVLLMARRMGRRLPQLAYWGHGDDLQHNDPNALRRRVKRWAISQVDHYFAYTAGSRERVVAAGMPPERVTVVQNSIAVTPAPQLAAVEREEARRRLSLPVRAPVALFCARLMENKKIPFLIEACILARTKVPDLTVLIIGDGPLAGIVAQAATAHPWLRPFGAQYGSEKSTCFAVSDFFLLPSMVGLSILDAFAAGLPVLAADFGNHSPEVEYLIPNVNGSITAPTVEAYASAIAELATEPSRRTAWGQAARNTASTHSLEVMVERFAEGIEVSLGREGH